MALEAHTLKIELVLIRKIHDKEPRSRTICSECGRRRMCTRVTHAIEGNRSVAWQEFYCSECLTRTPNWS